MRIDVSDAAWAVDGVKGLEPAKGQTVVFFYEREVKNNAKTIAEGRPIYDLVPFIKKMIPGDKNLEVDRKASPQDMLNFSSQWEAFKKKQEVPISGTPLEAWPLLDRKQVAEYKAMNIFTVDQIATLPDGYGAKIMGFQGVKQKAANFLAAAKDSGTLEKQAEELAKRDVQIAELQKQMAELMQNQKKKPGRKPKNAIYSSPDR